MAVIKAKLSGYIPVCMVLNGGHIRELDRATEMVKLQLKTRGFLHVQKVVQGERSFKVFTVMKKDVCVNEYLIKWHKKLGCLERGGLSPALKIYRLSLARLKTGS